MFTDVTESTYDTYFVKCYRKIVLAHSKKISLGLVTYVNTIFFFSYFKNKTCPATNYNCRCIRILNQPYKIFAKNRLEYLKENRKDTATETFIKKYNVSILDTFQDDGGESLFKTS